MVSKLLAYALAAAIVTSCLLGFGLWRSVAANGAIRAERDAAVHAQEQAAKALKRTEGILATTRAEKRVAGLQSAGATEALRRAQAASPDWAGTPTPPEVQKALSGALEGLE